MLRLAHNGRIAAKRRFWVNQVCGIQRGTAGFALVTVGMFITAMRTGSRNITVCKKLVRLFIKILHRRLFHKLACVKQLLEISCCRGMMLGTRRAAVDVERVFYNLVVTVHDVLRGNALFACLYGNRHTMLIASAYKHYLLTCTAQIPHIHIRRHVHPCQMSYMHWPIGIRECRCNGITLKLLVFLVVCHYFL